MLNLTLKNVPRDLHAQLKESAERNRRSLNSEIIARLESANLAPTMDAATLEKSLKKFTARFPLVEHSKVARYKRQGRA